MARQPEVFVRELDPAEARRLVKITRTARDRVRLRRAGIVLASMQGRSPAEAAGMFAATAQYAREVIHAFNEQGFAALDPKWSGGRPRKFGSVAREIVCRVAKTSPQQLGLPFTTWSLTKLVEHLARAASDRGQRRDGAAGPARGRDQLAGDQDVEGQPGSGVRGEDGRHPGAV
jgi:transposase